MRWNVTVICGKPLGIMPPYCTVARWVGSFSKDVCQQVMSNVRDDRSVCGPTWYVPSSSSSWRKTDDRDNKTKSKVDKVMSILCVLCWHSFAP
ncbi:hypothetical protein TNCT_504551 [Trichonephila clavata]|uniref:Uncharacterized protein n=1 Tax=Trichonephila clavata TaxID=2740835 RepID=A0A8X6JXP5_TRICU|nr:hypothetical protein TNCT_504551 [Trichonephila clavata]